MSKSQDKPKRDKKAKKPKAKKPKAPLSLSGLVDVDDGKPYGERKNFRRFAGSVE